MDVLIGVITRSEVAVNRDGTVPGRLLQAVLTDPRDAQTVELPQDGEEHNPIPGSRVFIVQAGPSCKLAVGVDDGVAPVMAVGGKRIYSVDADGAVKAEIRLFPDGKVVVQNANGSFTLNIDGSATTQNANGSIGLAADGSSVFQNDNGSVTLGADGSLTGLSDKVKLGKENPGAGILLRKLIDERFKELYDVHTHNYSVGGIPATTTAPNAALVLADNATTDTKAS